MTLEGIGKTKRDYKGNLKLLMLIASEYSNAFGGKGAKESEKFEINVSDILVGGYLISYSWYYDILRNG